MRIIVYIIFFLFCFKATIAQDEVYTLVEQPAEFPGGTSEMMKFLQKNIKYPAKARRLNVGGKVFVKFIVDQAGAITSAEVLKGTGMEEIDAEAIRVVMSMPTWSPAKMSGRTVRCYFNLPINFSLDSPYFIFSSNTSADYIAAKEAIFRNDMSAALEMYLNMPGNPSNWFNAGVIYYHKGNIKEARKAFEYVKDHSGNNKDTYYSLSTKFLANYF